MQEYKIITVTHKTASLQSLKDFLLEDADERDYPSHLLRLVQERMGIKELFYLNTCNRVMLFFIYDKPIDEQFFISFFKIVNPKFKEAYASRYTSRILTFEGKEAIRHLFEVSASLDSLVVGERQIIGQIRKAYHLSKKYLLSGDKIRLAIEQSVVFAKKIYAETRIGEKPVSVVSLAFRELLEKGIKQDSLIYIIGAGETNRLMSNLLAKDRYSRIKVFNRTWSKAKTLANRLNGSAYTLEELNKTTEKPDFILTCTASTVPVLKVEHLERWGIDKNQRLTIVDLAIPADTEPAILKQFAIDYIDIASLKEVADKNLASRIKEVEYALSILNQFVEDFQLKYKERRLELVFRTIPEQVKELKSFATERVFSKELADMDPHAREILDKVLNYMEKKYISIPMKSAKTIFLGEGNFK